MTVREMFSHVSRTAHHADSLTNNPTENSTDRVNSQPEKIRTVDPHAWMKGIDQTKIEALVVAHRDYDLIDQLIKCRAARHEITELIYHVSCMFDIVESAVGAAHRAIVDRKTKWLRVASWTVYGATIATASFFTTQPWIISPSTGICILTGAVALLCLYFWGRRLEAGAEEARIKTYSYRKATYISLHLASQGIETVIEELIQDEADALKQR